uniref:Uncharacterized protein n=1 Tax=Tanacetum cinerariifolium TaxID=118510 RepID=A0A699J5K8_TANCI|nr:hypothetical protein [Tanacetum cinerariifolium]
MDVSPSPDHVFDFPMAELGPHPVYDFFTAELIPRLAEAPGNMKGWIEEDVPLLGEMGEPIEIEDDDEWLMEPVTSPRATVTLLSTYEVGGPSSTTLETLFLARQPFPNSTHGTSMPLSVIDDLCVRMGNLEYGHRASV